MAAWNDSVAPGSVAPHEAQRVDKLLALGHRLARDAADLGFGRIAVSEKQAPNMLTNLL